MKTVSFTPFEIKMIETSLNHQVNCEQKSADCVYDLLRRFEKLRVETEHQGVREHLESLERIWRLGWVNIL